MIEILRLSHRPMRDKRITTHCALVARAFNADSITYSGVRDTSLEASIAKTVDNFGGKFSIKYEKSPVQYIKDKKSAGFLIIHLTVYGLPIQDKVSNLINKNLLIVIGSEKVPPIIYNLADLNISVTSQPHSEVAALAIILHLLNNGKELTKKFNKAKSRIIPKSQGKLVKKEKLYK